MTRKILFFLPNLSSGGAERVVSILSKSLSKKGFTIEIILFNDNNRAYEIESIISIKVLDGAGRMSKIMRVVNLHKYLRKQKNAIVVAFHPSCLKYALYAKIGTKCKVVACERNDPYNLYKSKKAKRKIKSYYNKADYAVFQTEDAKDFYGEVVQGKNHVIFNPVTPPNDFWKGDIDKHRIITVCRLEPQKNLYMAIDAISIIKKKYGLVVSLDVYGQGTLKDVLIEYCESLGVSSDVHFKGVTHMVYKELSDSSVFILTSNYEGISNSMLEALAVGIPVVCTDCPIGGARMAIINGENGYLVPIGDALMLSERIVALFNNLEKAKEISNQARKSAVNWTIDKITCEWEDVFNKI